jgi:hypothetical protein
MLPANVILNFSCLQEIFEEKNVGEHSDLTLTNRHEMVKIVNAVTYALL